MNTRTSLALLLCSFCFSVVSIAQATKKISEVLALEEGCPLPKIEKKITSSQEFNDMSVEVEAPPPPPPPVPAPAPAPAPSSSIESTAPPSAGDMAAKVQAYLKKVNIAFATMQYGKLKFFQDQNLLWGLKSPDGKILLSPRFEVIHRVSGDQYFVAKEINKKGFNLYTTEGKPLLSTEYQQVIVTLDKSGALLGAVVGTSEGYGLESPDGKVLIKAGYSQIHYAQNYWNIQKGNLFGIANMEGKIMIPPTYENLIYGTSNNSSAYFFAEDQNGVFTIIKNGKVVQQLGISFYQYGEGRVFDDRYLYFNGQLIDLKKECFVFCGDKVKIEKHNQALNLFSLKDSKENLIFNEKGELVSEFPVRQAIYHISFFKGLAIVTIVSDEKDPRDRPMLKSGLLNDKLEWVLKPEFLSMEMLTRDTNLYIVRNKELMMGVIDKNGKTIIPFVYQNMKVVDKLILAFKEALLHGDFRYIFPYSPSIKPQFF